MLNVKDVHRIGILVKDLDKAVKLFTTIFGAKVGITYRKDETENFQLTYDEIPPVGLKSAYLTIGEGFQIELMAASTPDGVMAKEIERKGEGIYSISFQVENVVEAIKDLEASGVRVVGKQLDWKTKTNQGDVHTPYALTHPKDTCGFMIEIGMR